MTARRQKSLSILEQGRFVDELLSTHQLTAADVAEMLSRSKAWVSTRRNLLSGMSVAIQQILFRGAFPVYSVCAHRHHAVVRRGGWVGVAAGGSEKAEQLGIGGVGSRSAGIGNEGRASTGWETDAAPGGAVSGEVRHGPGRLLSSVVSLSSEER